MEPLRQDDPRVLGEWTLDSRVWQSGSLVAFEARSTTERGVLVACRVHNFDSELSERVKAWFRNASSKNAWANVVLLDAEVTSGYGWVVYSLPKGSNIRTSVQHGRLLQADYSDDYLAIVRANYSQVAPILITPDTTYVDEAGFTVVGNGLTDFVQIVSPSHAQFSFNALQWLSPQELQGNGWDPTSVLFSISAVLAYGISGAAPWENPITSLTGLRERKIKEDLSSLPQCLVPWLRSDFTCLEHDPASTNTNEVVASLQEVKIDDAENRPNTPQDDPQGEEFPPQLSPPSPDGALHSHNQAPASRKSRQKFLFAGVLAVTTTVGAFSLFALTNSAAPESSENEPDRRTSPSATATGAPEGASSPAASARPSKTEKSYQIRLDYENENIPSMDPISGQTWTLDVCSGDRSLSSSPQKSKIRVERRNSLTDEWVEIKGSPKVVEGGRCESGQVNVTFSAKQQPPSELTTDGTWSRCLEHRITLPESQKFKKATVPFCVYLREI